MLTMSFFYGNAYFHSHIAKDERMQNPDVLKRLHSPPLPQTVLRREALLSRLNEVIAGREGLPSYKLVLLCAPAGYGKTTLLVDFARYAQMPCCWYMLDHRDLDRMVFLKLLFLSIRQQFPDFGKTLDTLLTIPAPAGSHHVVHTHYIEEAIEALAAAIASEIPVRFALMLCHYHRVNDCQGVNEVVNQLLLKLPPQCILVVESRAVPNLDYAILLSRDQIVGFDGSFLHFTTAEIRELAILRGVTSLKEKEAAQLARLFDGWITGILLGTRLGNKRLLNLGRKSYTPLHASEVHIDRDNLLAYLVSEVFSKEPEIHAFLQHMSILQYMTCELCNALLDITDSAETLQYIEQQGLFVTRDETGEEISYSCHPVLRELLYEELRVQEPERFNLLHRKAIVLSQQAQNLEMAIYHALEAALYEQAAQLILEVQEQFFVQGRVENLALWIDTLPSALLYGSPRLLLQRAKSYLFAGEYRQALPLLKTASDTVLNNAEAMEQAELILLLAKIELAQADVLFQMGEDEQVRQLCQQVIEQVPASEIALHEEAHTWLGACANTRGDYALGIIHLQKALQLWGRNSVRRQTARLHNMLARNYCLVGNFALAEHHTTLAARCWKSLQDGRGKVNNLLNMGLVKRRQGNMEAAKNAWQEALELARGELRFRRGEAYALFNLGELYQCEGRYEESLVAIEEALTLARERQDGYLASLAVCLLALTYLLMGDLETAKLLFAEVKYDASRYGFERAMLENTRGMILLFQKEYEKARACFSELTSYLSMAGLQLESLQTALRLAECLLGQSQVAEALKCIDGISHLLIHEHLEWAIRQELRILPLLKHAIQVRPELARMGVLFGLEGAEVRQAEEPIASVPVTLVPNSGTVSEARLQIFALGDPTIKIDGKTVTRWRMARAMELFFLLLDSDRPLRKDMIITALWPETDEEQIKQTLHSTVYYLRKTLGESCIVSHASLYWLNLASVYGEAVWYDVKVFQEHERKGREALNARDDATARAEFLAMVELYRGNYVQSFYSEWGVFQRDKLRLAYLDARQQLAHLAWRSEQFDESALHWQHILAVDNCLEEAHYGLMRCYLRQDKRGLALRQYQHCVRILRNELGIEPGSAIQNFYQDLLSDPIP